MAKVTSRLQVTIPKAVAVEYGIKPGDEVDFVPAGDAIRVVPARARRPHEETVRARLELFDAATRRQLERQASLPRIAEPADRGWRRDELYRRG